MTSPALQGRENSDYAGMAQAANLAQSLAGKIADLTGLRGVPGKIEESVSGVRDFANRQIDDLLNGAISAARSTSRFAESALHKAGVEVDQAVDGTLALAKTAYHELSEAPAKAMDLLGRANQAKKQAQKRSRAVQARAKAIRAERLGGIQATATHWQELAIGIEEELDADARSLEQLGEATFEEAHQNFERTVLDAEHHQRVLGGQVKATHRRATRLKSEVSGGIASTKEWAGQQAKKASKFKSERLAAAKSIGSVETAGAWAADSMVKAKQLVGSIHDEAASKPQEAASFGQRRVEEAMQLSQNLRHGVQTAREWITAQSHAQSAWRMAMNIHEQRSSGILENQTTRITAQIATVRSQMDQPVPPNLVAPIEQTLQEARAVEPIFEEPVLDFRKPAIPEESFSDLAPPIAPTAVVELDSPKPRPSSPVIEKPAAPGRTNTPAKKPPVQQPSPVSNKEPAKTSMEMLSIRHANPQLPISAAAPTPITAQPPKSKFEFDTHIASPKASPPSFPSLEVEERAESPKALPTPKPEATPDLPNLAIKSPKPRKSKMGSISVSGPSSASPVETGPPQITLPPQTERAKPTPSNNQIAAATQNSPPKPGPLPTPKKQETPTLGPFPAVNSKHKPKSGESPHQPEKPREFHDRLLASEGAGAAPDASIRSKLAPHVGFDPAVVRLHTGPGAQSAARSLGADAFTIGRDVFFGAGKYNPTSSSGLGLIGHEVTHVGQQLGLRGDKLRFLTKTGGDAMEQEAQQVGERIASNVSAGPRLKVAEFVRVYQPADDEPITTHLQTRLDQLSLKALRRASSFLPPNRRNQPIRLDEVNVDLTLDMEAMSDSEIVDLWAEAILAAVEVAQSQGRINVQGGQERLIQRQPTDIAPLPTPQSLPDSNGQNAAPNSAIEAKIREKVAETAASPEDRQKIRQLHVRKFIDKQVKAAKEERNSMKWKALRLASGVAIVPALEIAEEDQPYVKSMLKEFDIASFEEFQLIEAQFIKMFATKGILATKLLLDQNRQIAQHELDRYWGVAYGATPDMDKLRAIAGQLADSAFSFTSRYNTIVEQENLYNRFAKIRPKLPIATSSQMPLIGSILTDVNLPSGYYEELRPRWEAWMKERAKHGKEFPILLSDFDISDIRGEANKGALATKMGLHVAKILDDIDYVDKELDEDRFWKLPKMIDLTRDTLGVKNADGSGITLNEYIKDKKEDEALWEMIKAAAAIALAIAGMVATGGLAAVAMVGSAGMSVHSAVKASYDYAFNKAAINTSVEMAKRISRDEPSLLALAVEIVGAILDVGGAMHAFASIKSAAKAASALDPESMSKLRDAAASAYDDALKQGGELKMGKESFVNRIVDFGAKGMATAEHTSDKLRMMAELSKGTSNRVRLLMKNDPAAIEKLINDFGEVDELVDILLECGEEGKKILTNVGNHIHAKQTKAAADVAADGADDVAKAGKAADNAHGAKTPDAVDDVIRPSTQAPLKLPPPQKPWNRKDLKVLLEGTQEGRHALAMVEKYNIKVLKQRTKPGQVFFQAPDTIYIWHDMRPQHAMYGYIHEAGHAEWLKTGKTADIYQTHRDLYVSKMIREETEVQANAIKARMDLMGFNSGGAVQFDAATALEKTYYDAYMHFAAKYRKQMGDEVQEWLVNEYASRMAKNVMHSAITKGEVLASVGNIDYVTYYGRQWDRVRLHASGDKIPRPAMVPPPPKGWNPTATSPTVIPGAAQSHLVDANNAVKSVATLPKGSLDNSIGLSSAGSAGSVGLGVHPTTFRGQPVVVKLFYPNQAAILEGEMAALLAAEKTMYGPKVHGKITYQTQKGDTRIGIVMDRVEGGFADMADGSGAALVKAEAEMMDNAKHINHLTFRDLMGFRDRLIEQGYYYWGELQGFVDKNGRWRPIDLQGAVPIHEVDPRHVGMKSTPNLSEPDAIKRHNKAFDEMFDKLYKNQQKAQKKTP